MKPLSKKKFIKKKGIVGVTIHAEGKYFCDCLTRNYRKWLGVKRYGQEDAQAGDKADSQSREDLEEGGESQRQVS